MPQFCVTPRSRLPAWGMLAVALAAACSVFTSSPDAVPTQLSVGGWGGLGAGAIVSDTGIHIHVGCTLGDFPRPAVLDSTGRFSVEGSYVLRAYPVQVGPELPARLSGVVRGSRLTFSVAVEDTVEKKLVALGPLSVTLGQEPRLGPCPICRKPGERAKM